MELKQKLFNILAEVGKMAYVYNEAEEEIGRGTHWFIKEKDLVMLYEPKRKTGNSVDVRLDGIENIKKNGYQMYLVTYLDGEKIQLKMRAK